MFQYHANNFPTLENAKQELLFHAFQISKRVLLSRRILQNNIGLKSHCNTQVRK